MKRTFTKQARKCESQNLCYCFSLTFTFSHFHPPYGGEGDCESLRLPPARKGEPRKGKGKMTDEETIEVGKIKAALARLIKLDVEVKDSERVRYLRKEAKDPNYGPYLFPLRESIIGRSNQLCMNPEKAAIGLGVRVLGQRLNEIGGYDLMAEVCDPTCKSVGAGWSMVDSAWGNIGTWP